jgi:predicted small lipoprotein YifL
MFFLHRIIAAMFLLGMVSACGQKGPLFLAPQSVPYSLFPGKTADTPPLATAPPLQPASAAK